MALTVFVACVLLVAAIGARSAYLPPASRVIPAAWRRTGSRWVETARQRGYGLVPPVVTWVAGTLAILAVMWPLGRAVYRLEDAVDWPVFYWFAEHQIPWWTRVNDTVTLMGNTTQTRTATVVGAVGLAVAAWFLRRRRWGLPLLVLPAAYLTGHYLQLTLAAVVDRGHPPTARGTWPSGGVARTLLVYGLIVYFLLVYLAASRAVRTAAWTAVAMAATVEAYTRVYLLKHWLTDVLPGGLLYGACLLVLFIAVTRLLDHDQALPRRPRRRVPSGQGR